MRGTWRSNSRHTAKSSAFAFEPSFVIPSSREATLEESAALYCITAPIVKNSGPKSLIWIDSGQTAPPPAAIRSCTRLIATSLPHKRWPKRPSRRTPTCPCRDCALHWFVPREIWRRPAYGVTSNRTPLKAVAPPQAVPYRWPAPSSTRPSGGSSPSAPLKLQSILAT